ncbi:ATP-grasp domain-containing protein [Cohnella sp. CFH 77786]|uniref:ATP-grasp domain-containing protein n=1 Tax=Cohnella sp. CFH 77786 TaxID=2662265 RepID=UPI001C60A570
MTKPAKVMVVGGGEWQVPLIRKAKDMGLTVLCTNPYPDSPGFAYADFHELADVKDVAAHERISQRFRPDAIVTDQTDIAVPTVARLCERSGLPGIGTDIAGLFTDKSRMRQFCLEHGFPCPPFRLCRTMEDVKDFIGENGLPIILKPVSSQASRGVKKVASVADLPELYADTLLHAGGRPILAERYIGGFEITMEGLAIGGSHTTLAVSRKKHLNAERTIASELLYTGDDPEIDYEKVMETHNRMIEAMKLPFGITHAEYKIDQGRFYLIEAAARGGGTKISSHIVPAVSGVDAQELLIRMALGEPVGALPRMPIPRPRLAAILGFFLLPEGTIAQITGMEAIRSLPFVLDAGLSVRSGDRVAVPRDDGSRAGYFLATGQDEAEVRSRASMIRSMLEVRYA